MKKILQKLEKTAKRYDLKFNKNMFKINYISKEDYWMLSFAYGSPVWWTEKYNKPGQRRKDINKFISSREYKK